MIFPLILRLTSGCVFFRSSAVERPVRSRFNHTPPCSALRPPAFSRRAISPSFLSSPRRRILPPPPPRTPARVFPLRGRPAVRLSRRGLFLIPASFPRQKPTPARLRLILPRRFPSGDRPPTSPYPRLRAPFSRLPLPRSLPLFSPPFFSVSLHLALFPVPFSPNPPVFLPFSLARSTFCRSLQYR